MTKQTFAASIETVVEDNKKAYRAIIWNVDVDGYKTIREIIESDNPALSMKVALDQLDGQVTHVALPSGEIELASDVLTLAEHCEAVAA